MHWVLYFTTAAPVEASATAKIETTVTRSLNVQTSSPLWLNLTVHLANAIVAWTDVHVSDRTFRKSSLNQSLIFCLVYTTWIQVCAFKNKMYPYPFLNKLPQPEGFIATVAVAVTLTFAFFKAGSTLASVQTSRRLAKLKAIMSDYSDSEDDYDDREADIACDWSDGPKQQNDPLFKLHCQLCSCPLAVTFHSSIGAVDFSERQAVVAVLPCNHCFHSVCLDDYSSSSQQLRCPVFKGPSLACAEFQERQRLAEQHQRERERLAERRREKERLAAQQRLEQEAARTASSKGKWWGNQAWSSSWAISSLVCTDEIEEIARILQEQGTVMGMCSGKVAELGVSKWMWLELAKSGMDAEELQTVSSLFDEKEVGALYGYRVLLRVIAVEALVQCQLQDDLCYLGSFHFTSSTGIGRDGIGISSREKEASRDWSKGWRRVFSHQGGRRFDMFTNKESAEMWSLVLDYVERFFLNVRALNALVHLMCVERCIHGYGPQTTATFVLKS
ncbi:hypothetical protein SELMODRAFT_439021 [Selaginella moellendorffii]|uniref:RING-type domain-containing protein n=1 Tax=Selaginella moellendorffii TaxID=88036 RepID=D8R1T3_SELML|nr:hypothetical protein SELMODRAFT_439021 [Selaginella moellendorffii]